MTALRTVVILSLGGTIASVQSDSGKARAGALSGEDLLAKLKLGDAGPLEMRTLAQKPSNALTGDDLLALHRECTEIAARKDVAGIVVSQGTDTLEDTACFLDTTLELQEIGVVITGAQRVPYAAGSDAGPNLRDAITVARSEQARGQGALVVFNEEVHAGDSVRKVSSYHLDGFGSPGWGPLGHVDGSDLYLRRRGPRAPVVTPGGCLPRVDILPVSLGAHPAIIMAAIESGARALVIDALGRGHVPPDWMDALKSAVARGACIAVTSSTSSGPLAEAYEYAGSLAELTAIGAIPVHHVTARKARIRMMCVLSTGVMIDAAVMNPV